MENTASASKDIFLEAVSNFFVIIVIIMTVNTCQAIDTPVGAAPTLATTVVNRDHNR